ncbi:MAG: hypothetical protein HYR60_02670 [Acidobacteria bacterium]|nr:hypothetical protein [Acidobacteriota bacterium]
MALLLLPLSTASAQKCSSDIPTQWTLNDYYVDGTTFNRIRSDSAGPYINGQSGVSASIQICNGTGDALLKTGSSRQLSFDFGRMLASNANTPSWASGTVTGGGGTLHIRHVTFVPVGYDRSQEYTFTTWVGSMLPVKFSWNLRMWKPTTDAFSGNLYTDVNVATANTPYIDTPVNMHHCPANSAATTGPCAGVIHETWFASPDPGPTTYADGTPAPSTATQVAALVSTQKATPVNAGQFSMPFYFVISLLQ